MHHHRYELGEHVFWGQRLEALLQFAREAVGGLEDELEVTR